MNKLLLIIILLLGSTHSFSSVTEEGSGIIYGDNHAFSLQAPEGWVLDNESGVNQGVHAVFYPIGNTWNNSNVVAYSKAITKDSEIEGVPSYVKFTIRSFHNSGSPHYSGKFIEKINSINNDKKADIYYFEGDKWGNYEAVAYFEEDKTINIVVLNSRNKSIFDAALEAFYKLAKSYMFLTEKVIFTNRPKKTFKQAD